MEPIIFSLFICLKTCFQLTYIKSHNDNPAGQTKVPKLGKGIPAGCEQAAAAGGGGVSKKRNSLTK